MHFKSFISYYYGKLFLESLQHLAVILYSIPLAIITGVLTGFYISNKPRVAGTVLFIASIIIFVPSLALFGIMVVLPAPIKLGLGVTPAVMAITLYSLLPIIRNTCTALNDVNLRIVEAAKGMGLSWNRIIWSEKTAINNTYAPAVGKNELGTRIKTLSGLARYNKKIPDKLIYGVAHEFYQRHDGFRKMLEFYNMKVSAARIITMDIGLTFESISRRQIGVAMVYSTEGKLKKFNLLVLEDDRHFFPVYNL